MNKYQTVFVGTVIALALLVVGWGSYTLLTAPRSRNPLSPQTTSSPIEPQAPRTLQDGPSPSNLPSAAPQKENISDPAYPNPEPSEPIPSGQARPLEREKDFYREFMKLFRADPKRFRSELERTLLETAAPARKIAALRASYDTHSDPALNLFWTALSTPSLEPKIPNFAVRFLVQKSPRDEQARRVLRSFVEKAPQADTASRRNAVSAIYAHATDAELYQMQSLPYAESDPETIARIAQAMVRNGSQAAQTLLIQLCGSHPNTEARHRTEEERTGQYCEYHQNSQIESE